MLDLFFDSSALAKRYISETGSNWVTNACSTASGNVIFVAEIAGVEITSAIIRRSRGGSLTPADAQASLLQFEADWATEYFVLEINSSLLDEARALSKTYALRGYDAVQLAVVVNLNREQLATGLPSITFVAADDELLNAAQAESLRIENPNNYS